MSLFDAADLQAYLGSSVVIDDVQAVILDQVVTALIEAELVYDPSPSDDPITIRLSVEDDHTVLLPRLLDSVVSVQANGIAVRYVQHGNTLTVATATLATTAFLLWVNDRTIDVTYTYETVPATLAAAALLTAATMVAANPNLAGAVTVLGAKSEQIDDYQVTYAAASDIFGTNGLPPQASALLRPFKRSGRSVKLRA